MSLCGLPNCLPCLRPPTHQIEHHLGWLHGPDLELQLQGAKFEGFSSGPFGKGLSFVFSTSSSHPLNLFAALSIATGPFGKGCLKHPFGKSCLGHPFGKSGLKHPFGKGCKQNEIKPHLLARWCSLSQSCMGRKQAKHC